MNASPMRAPERLEFGDRIPLEHVLQGTGQHLLGALGSFDWRDDAKRLRMLEDLRARLKVTLRVLDGWLEANGK